MFFNTDAGYYDWDRDLIDMCLDTPFIDEIPDFVIEYLTDIDKGNFINEYLIYINNYN